MIRRPPRSTRTDTLFPYTTLFRAPQNLGAIHQPVLVANGDHDIMVPSTNSIALAARIPGAALILYEDAGHGGIFQYHDAFVTKTRPDERRAGTGAVRTCRVRGSLTP